IGGFAMGTVGGMRTRRYHGLLAVATDPPRGRHLALAALDPVLVAGTTRTRLGVHEWAGTTVQPQGFVHLESFSLRDGVPAWRWQVGDVVIERDVAGRPHGTVRELGPRGGDARGRVRLRRGVPRPGAGVRFSRRGLVPQRQLPGGGGPRAQRPRGSVLRRTVPSGARAR